MGLTITATSMESDGTTVATSHGFNVHVTGVADTPDLTLTPATGVEDSAIPLTISPSLNDVDGSETLSVTVSSIPNGFTLSAGTVNADGTVTLTPAELSGLTISGPQDYSGNFDLTITAQSEEADGNTADISTTLPVTFTGVADVPDVAASPGQGTEDTPLPLNLSAAATDVDGSESITAAVITGVPSGFTLTNATNNNDGTWTVTDPANLGDVAVSATEHFSGSVNLGLTVTATDTGGDTKTNSVGFTAAFTPVPDAPNVSAIDVPNGQEDTAISLNLSSSLVDTDGSESLGVVISGVPTGATLSHGTPLGNGQFAININDLTNLLPSPRPCTFPGTWACRSLPLPRSPMEPPPRVLRISMCMSLAWPIPLA